MGRKSKSKRNPNKKLTTGDLKSLKRRQEEKEKQSEKIKQTDEKQSLLDTFVAERDSIVKGILETLTGQECRQKDLDDLIYHSLLSYHSKLTLSIFLVDFMLQKNLDKVCRMYLGQKFSREAQQRIGPMQLQAQRLHVLNCTVEEYKKHSQAVSRNPISDSLDGITTLHETLESLLIEQDFEDLKSICAEAQNKYPKSGEDVIINGATIFISLYDDPMMKMKLHLYSLLADVEDGKLKLSTDLHDSIIDVAGSPEIEQNYIALQLEKYLNKKLIEEENGRMLSDENKTLIRTFMTILPSDYLPDQATFQIIRRVANYEWRSKVDVVTNKVLKNTWLRNNLALKLDRIADEDFEAIMTSANKWDQELLEILIDDPGIVGTYTRLKEFDDWENIIDFIDEYGYHPINGKSLQEKIKQYDDKTSKLIYRNIEELLFGDHTQILIDAIEKGTISEEALQRYINYGMEGAAFKQYYLIQSLSSEHDTNEIAKKLESANDISLGHALFEGNLKDEQILQTIAEGVQISESVTPKVLEMLIKYRKFQKYDLHKSLLGHDEAILDRAHLMIERLEAKGESYRLHGKHKHELLKKIKEGTTVDELIDETDNAQYKQILIIGGGTLSTESGITLSEYVGEETETECEFISANSPMRSIIQKIKNLDECSMIVYQTDTSHSLYYGVKGHIPDGVLFIHTGATNKHRICNLIHEKIKN